MEHKKPLQAEELLEKIFYYMNQLVDEKGFSSTILLLTDMGRTLVNSERASFWYWDRGKKQYWTLAALGSERIIVPEGAGIVGASIRENKTIVINNPYEDERFNAEVDRETGFITKSILCMPVKNAKGEVIGAYQAINKLDENGQSDFNDRDVGRLTMAAVYCGKTLESHLLYHEAQVDQLTGLKNRRGFYEYYSDYVRPKFQNGPASVIMCDVDFFKKVNDTFGHNAGDAVLIHVADMLRQGAAGQGEVIRWGGEEFVLLFTEMALEQAADLAERIRSNMEKAVCRFEELDIQITMSFGVSELDASATPDVNIEHVDAKLYEAKATGRNKVVW
ncbi:MAG: sensor domain-containing diguanylate cyclase [Bacteroidales bacterium]|nr:sensor domain-containing diguanylate cyclase [Clostridium sp.]MCM1203006.1 sensor domain-containing diguanylate cyclase [Bacteroidales bacterium]